MASGYVTNFTPYTTILPENYTERLGKDQETSSADKNSRNGEESLPIWILCGATSGIFTLIALYIFLVLARHAINQNASRIARRQRDSVLFPAKYMQSGNAPKLHELPSAAQKSFDESEQQQRQGVQPIPNKMLYQEQISVESMKSNSNLITTSANGPQEYGGNVIAVYRVKEKDRGAWLHRAIVLCAFVAFVRGVLEQCLIQMGHLSDNTCDVLTKSMIAFTALSLHCCHVFLWLRQLTFYSNPFLKPLRSSKLKMLSYAAYAIMPITLAIALALYMWWRNYESVNGVCMASRKQNLSTYVPFGVLVACTVTIQILLSALFLYPLVVHKMKRMGDGMKKAKKENDGPESPCTTVPVAPKSRNSDRLIACIKRVLYGATIGITTDVVGGLVSMFLPDDIPMYAYAVLYNLNVSLNVFCLIYTFANWRQMLFPWCCPSDVERNFRASKRRRRTLARNAKSCHRNSSLKKNGISTRTYRMRILDS